jgi:hypothetical protein
MRLRYPAVLSAGALCAVLIDGPAGVRVYAVWFERRKNEGEALLNECGAGDGLRQNSEGVQLG